MDLDLLSRSQLEAEYRRTDYIVDDDGLRFTIRLDRSNTGLDETLRSLQVSSWAFLTACNPCSKALTEEQNKSRQHQLTKLLDENGYRYFRAKGVGDGWQEPSLFIIEITRDAAIDIGKRFEQNAILWGAADAEPELIWCVDLEPKSPE